MVRDNERMRGQLIELGFDVPVRRYLFNSGEDTQSSQKHSDAIPTEPRVASSTTIDPDNQRKLSSFDARLRLLIDVNRSITQRQLIVRKEA